MHCKAFFQGCYLSSTGIITLKSVTKCQNHFSDIQPMSKGNKKTAIHLTKFFIPSSNCDTTQLPASDTPGSNESHVSRCWTSSTFNRRRHSNKSAGRMWGCMFVYSLDVLRRVLRIYQLYIQACFHIDPLY